MYLDVIMAVGLLAVVVGLPITWWREHAKDHSRKQQRETLLAKDYREHFPRVREAYFKWRAQVMVDDLSRAGKAGDELRSAFGLLEKDNQSRACNELDRHQNTADRAELAGHWRRELQERAKALGQPS
jgi:hypothetical protein